MRIFRHSSTACLLWASISFISLSSAATTGSRAVACAATEQTCRSEFGTFFCCPQKNMECGALKQCIPKKSISTKRAPPSTILSTRTTTLEPSSATVAPLTESAAIAPTAVQNAPSSAPSPTTVATAEKSEEEEEKGFVGKVKKFFTPTMIIVFASAGGGAFLLLTVVCCFCYRKRKQGRLLLAAYENPNRNKYESLTPAAAAELAKKQKNGETVPPMPTVPTTTKAVVLDLPPPSAEPARPQPVLSPQQKYFDLYSPESPAFQMTEQKPAGPLERDNGNTGYYPPQEYQQNVYPPTQQPYYQDQYQQYPQQQQTYQQNPYTQPYAQQSLHAGHYETGNRNSGFNLDMYSSSPADSYKAGNIYADYATYQDQGQGYPQGPRAPSPVYGNGQPQYQRQLTPPNQHYANASIPSNPSRPHRGPDVYLPPDITGSGPPGPGTTHAM